MKFTNSNSDEGVRLRIACRLSLLTRQQAVSFGTSFRKELSDFGLGRRGRDQRCPGACDI